VASFTLVSAFSLGASETVALKSHYVVNMTDLLKQELQPQLP
jgi:hypothetical protein